MLIRWSRYFSICFLLNHSGGEFFWSWLTHWYFLHIFFQQTGSKNAGLIATMYGDLLQTDDQLWHIQLVVYVSESMWGRWYYGVLLLAFSFKDVVRTSIIKTPPAPWVDLAALHISILLRWSSWRVERRKRQPCCCVPFIRCNGSPGTCQQLVVCSLVLGWATRDLSVFLSSTYKQESKSKASWICFILFETQLTNEGSIEEEVLENGQKWDFYNTKLQLKSCCKGVSCDSSQAAKLFYVSHWPN